MNSQNSLLPALMNYATESRSIGLMSPSEETSSLQETSADAIITAATGAATPTTDTTPSSGENVRPKCNFQVVIAE